jgi:hypothetical protein
MKNTVKCGAPMAWFRPADGRLTSEDIRAIIRSEMTPVTASIGVLSAKVDTLVADHVPRADLTALRKEMQDGFSALDSRFMPRELSEQRYKDLTEQIKDLQTAAATQATRRFTLGTNAPGWAVMTIGVIISLISLILVIVTHR